MDLRGMGCADRSLILSIQWRALVLAVLNLRSVSEHEDSCFSRLLRRVVW
jgi:hypothetical protein